MSTHYTAGSMPLAFTQEDFLVLHLFLTLIKQRCIPKRPDLNGCGSGLDLPLHLALPPSCCPVALPGVCCRKTPPGIYAGRTEGFLVPEQSLHPLQLHTTNPASTDLDLLLSIHPSNENVKFSGSGR